MTHFAEIDSDGIVLRVIVAEQDFIDSEVLGPKENWIQTSYNTHKGIHTKGKTPLRKNYAGIGYKYISSIDGFVPPTSFPSWKLNNEKGVYEAPISKPNDGKKYVWDEVKKGWIINRIWKTIKI